MLFFIFLVLTAVAVLFFLVPLFSKQVTEDVMPREGVNTLVFRERLRELEEDYAQAKIDESQFQQLKKELEIALLNDVSVAEQPATASAAKGGRVAAIVLAVAIPFISLGLYQWEGQTKAVDSWLATQAKWKPLIEGSLQGRSVDPEQAKDLTSADYIRVLQAILQRSPEHVDGWQSLGIAFMQVGLPSFAETAFRRAYELVPNDVELALLIVESKLAQGRGALDESAVALLHRILEQAPQNPKARMMLGMVSYNQGDYRHAIKMWSDLLRDIPADSEGAQILQSSIARAEAMLGDKKSGGSESGGNEKPEEGEKIASAPSSPAITVDVTVAEAIKKDLERPLWLMVYAKAVDGLPMPVAIKKQAYSDDAVSVTLDDRDAMAPMAKLSTSKTVKVFARLSKTGTATPQPGDHFAESEAITVSPQTQHVALEINQTVK